MNHQIGGRGELDIVDAQVHFGPQPGLDGLRCAMDALGVRSVVLDELWGRNERNRGIPCVEFGSGAFRPLSPLAQAAAIQDPARFAFLRRVVPGDPGLAAMVPMLAQEPGCVSLRVVTYSKADREAFVNGEYDEICSLAQEHELPLSVLTRDIGPLLAAIAPRFPRLQFIVDHCGWPRDAQQWDDVLALARHENAWLKWSHAYRAFGADGDTHTPMRDAFAQAVKAFDASRILWASDVTYEESRQSWAQLLGFVLYQAPLSDRGREWVLGRTARQVFGRAFASS